MKAKPCWLLLSGANQTSRVDILDSRVGEKAENLKQMPNKRVGLKIC
jgi:hypothetical protein